MTHAPAIEWTVAEGDRFTIGFGHSWDDFVADRNRNYGRVLAGHVLAEEAFELARLFANGVEKRLTDAGSFAGAVALTRQDPALERLVCSDGARFVAFAMLNSYWQKAGDLKQYRVDHPTEEPVQL